MTINERKNMKTKEQIDAEIQKLASLKPRVRHYSGFGDDHHEAIEAQLSVLAENMSYADIHESWGDEDAGEFAQNVLDDAIYARDWVMCALAEDTAPSEQWKELAA